jgi:putative heme transporter
MVSEAGFVQPSVAPGRRTKVWRGLLMVSAIVLTTWYASRLTSWEEVIGILGGMSAGAVAVVVGLTLLNIVTYWLVLAASIPGLGVARAGSLQLPSTAISNVLPAGGVVGTGFTVVRLRAWGHAMGDVAAALVVNGVLGTAAKVTAGIVAVLALSPTAEATAAAPTLAMAAIAVVVVGVAKLLSSRSAAVVVAGTAERLVGRLLGFIRRPQRPALLDATVRLQTDVGSLLRARWPALVAATVLSHVALFALFVTCFRAVGLDAGVISTTELVASFGVARVASLIPLTPGGVGLIEIALTASLTAKGGEPDLVVAGVALYRLGTYIAPTLLGLVVLAGWSVLGRRRRARGRAPVGGDDAERADVPLVVDLDGTLFPVTTRTLMVARLAWRQPGALPVYWRTRRARRLESKFFLWELAGIDLDRVPVRGDLMDRLRAERAAGRDLYLASGAPDPLVRAVVRDTGLFVDGWGSTPSLQLVGGAKAALLESRFGHGGFDYVGDANEDLEVWPSARAAVLYRPGPFLRRAAVRRLRCVEIVRRPPGHTVALAVRTVVACLAQHPFRRRRPDHAPAPSRMTDDDLQSVGGKPVGVDRP